MDNPRLFLWIGLALLAWMNVIQWDRDYGAQSAAAAPRRRHPARRQRRRTAAGSARIEPAVAAVCRGSRAPRTTAATATAQPPAIARRAPRDCADDSRRHRRARHGHQPAGRRPAARRPAEVPAGQEAGQPAGAPAVDRRRDVQRRAQRPARGRRPRRTDAPRDVHRAGHRVPPRAGRAGTARAADVDGRAGRHRDEDLRLQAGPVRDRRASTTCRTPRPRTGRPLRTCSSCGTCIRRSARCSTSRATRSAVRPCTTARSTRSSTSTTRTTPRSARRSPTAGWPRCSITSCRPPCRRRARPTISRCSAKATIRWSATAAR